MISNAILKEIEKKLKGVMSSFGGSTSLVESVARNVGDNSDGDITKYEIAKILYHPDAIATISPWSYRFGIAKYLDTGLLDEDSIILEEPYQVFTSKGKLLYSVSSHQGVFGNSVLDKLLVIESDSGSLYYLQFPMYKGFTRTIQLIVNQASTTSPISIPQFKAKPTISETNIRNTILLRAGSTYRNNLVLGNPIYPITFHLQAATSASNPNASSVIANASTSITFSMEVEDYVLLHPQQSGWVVLTQSTATSTMMLNIGNVSGQGASRLLEVSPFLYYLAASPEEDMNIIRQNLGLVSKTVPNPKSISSINITGDLLQ